MSEMAASQGPQEFVNLRLQSRAAIAGQACQTCQIR